MTSELIATAPEETQRFRLSKDIQIGWEYKLELDGKTKTYWNTVHTVTASGVITVPGHNKKSKTPIIDHYACPFKLRIKAVPLWKVDRIYHCREMVGGLENANMLTWASEGPCCLTPN